MDGVATYYYTMGQAGMSATFTPVSKKKLQNVLTFLGNRARRQHYLGHLEF